MSEIPEVIIDDAARRLRDHDEREARDTEASVASLARPSDTRRYAAERATLRRQEHDATRALEVIDGGSDDDPNNGWVDALESSLVAFDDAFWSADNVADWLVEPIIPTGRQVALVAAPKAGKSLLTLYIAACAATGRSVLDRPVGDPVHVIYADQEMTQDDLRERLLDMGFGPDDDLSHLHYYSLAPIPPLDTPAGGQALAEVARHHSAALVIVDTVSRLTAGEENAADTYSDMYRHTGLRLKAAGIAFVRLDHSGHKDTDRARGSSAKAADVDLIWNLTPTDIGVKLKRTHQRISWAPETVDLKRTDDPLSFSLASGSWPAGTRDTATHLDRLGVPVDASRRHAADALKAAGHGRRAAVVSAALKYRRQLADLEVQTLGTTAGTTSPDTPGTTSGTNEREPRDTAPEPLPEPLGTTTPGDWEPHGSPLGEPVSRPSDLDREGII